MPYSILLLIAGAKVQFSFVWLVGHNLLQFTLFVGVVCKLKVDSNLHSSPKSLGVIKLIIITNNRFIPKYSIVKDA